MCHGLSHTVMEINGLVEYIIIFNYAHMRVVEFFVAEIHNIIMKVGE